MHEIRQAANVCDGEPGLLGRFTHDRIPRVLAAIDVAAGDPDVKQAVAVSHDAAWADDQRRRRDVHGTGAFSEQVITQSSDLADN